MKPNRRPRWQKSDEISSIAHEVAHHALPVKSAVMGSIARDTRPLMGRPTQKIRKILRGAKEDIDHSNALARNPSMI